MATLHTAIRCWVVTLAVALVSAGCGSTPVYDDFGRVPPPSAVPIHDTAIKPGERIGPVSVGMTAKQLLAAAGEPGSTDNYTASDGRAMQSMHFGALEVHMPVQDPQRVTSITVKSPQYTIAGGAHVGSSTLMFSSLLGPADSIQRITWCYSSGLAVNFENGVATAIIVQTPGC